jgi:TolB-like protein
MHEPIDRRTSLLDELKRRRVVRVAIGYIGAMFVLLQGVQVLVEALMLPDGLLRVLALTALAGFPAALVLSWAFDLNREGIRLTGPGTESGRLVLRLPRRAIVGGGTGLLLACLALLVVVYRPDMAAARVVPGAETIAVLPFSVSGESVRDLEHGMVDLLSRNLNEVGTIRTVDPRAVLMRWQAHLQAGQVSFDEALQVAREVNAGSVLTGSVVAAGPRVRISADLHGVDGGRIAAVQVDGAVDDVLALVDSVSVALLREIWQSRQPLPRLSVSAVTTGNMDAIRAFIAGERHYRAAAWDSALIAFDRAVAADSTFALAHYRIATTADWGGTAEQGDAGIAAALRLVDRLPQREQTLLRAAALRRQGERAAAVDTLSAYVERYPDDPEAWFYLADEIFHLRADAPAPGGATSAEQFWMFERALALDPTFTPALIHPLEVGFGSADTALVSRFVAHLDRSVTATHGAAGIYRAGLRALRAPADTRAIDEALRASFVEPRHGVQNLEVQAAAAVRPAMLRLAARLPAGERRVLRRSLEAEPGTAAMLALAPLLVLDGETAAARRLLEAAAAQREAYAPEIRDIVLATVLAGHADSTFFLGAAAAVSDASRTVARLVAAIDARDRAALRAALADTGRIESARRRSAVAAVGEGFLTVLQGDTARGLARLSDALEREGFHRGSFEALWFRGLELRAAYGPERERARAALQAGWPGSPLYEPRRLRLLARLAG